MLTHDSRLIDVIFAQCLLMACVAWSVIFLQSDKSKRSMLWQCWASVLKTGNSRRVNIRLGKGGGEWETSILPQWLIADRLAATQGQILQESAASLWNILDNGSLQSKRNAKQLCPQRWCVTIIAMQNNHEFNVPRCLAESRINQFSASWIRPAPICSSIGWPAVHQQNFYFFSVIANESNDAATYLRTSAQWNHI